MYKRGLIIILLVFINGCTDVVEDSKCVIAGCSSQVCVTEEKAKDLFTTCEFKEEYRCFKFSNCRIIDGECGWEQTEEYLECLEEVKK